MVCSTCKHHFSLTLKIFADKQCPKCHREDSISTYLIVEPSDGGDCKGIRRFLSECRFPELQAQINAMTKKQLAAPEMLKPSAIY